MEELDWANIVVGGSFVIVSILAQILRPEKPNKFMGYRTKMSMLNKTTWKMGNDHLSKGLLLIALVTISGQIFIYLTIDKTTALLVSAVVFTMGLGTVVILTEIKLKKNFNADGSPKKQSRF